MDQIEQKHSRVGIASFIISVLDGALMCLVIGLGVVLEISKPGNSGGNLSLLIGLGIIGLLLVCLVGLGLGIGGMFEKDRKRIFAVLGTVFSLAIILGVGMLMLVGANMN